VIENIPCCLLAFCSIFAAWESSCGAVPAARASGDFDTELAELMDGKRDGQNSAGNEGAWRTGEWNLSRLPSRLWTNRASMEHSSRGSYQLSIDIVIVEYVIRIAEREFERVKRKLSSLKEMDEE